MCGTISDSAKVPRQIYTNLQADALCLQCQCQSLCSTGAMGFHAPLGATHYLGGFSDVELLPITQDKGLTLTRRQSFNFLLDDPHGLRPRNLVVGALRLLGPVLRLQSFQGIVIGIVRLGASRCHGREKGGPEGTHLGTAEMVAGGVLQDALEQQRQFLGRAVAVFFGQAHHGFLHDVERGFVVAHGENRLLVGAALDFSQKIRQFFRGSQGCARWGRRPIAGRIMPLYRLFSLLFWANCTKIPIIMQFRLRSGLASPAGRRAFAGPPAQSHHAWACGR